MNYLFGDIVKMCLFGYVLCDSDFSVIKNNNILMNTAAKITNDSLYFLRTTDKFRNSFRRTGSSYLASATQTTSQR